MMRELKTVTLCLCVVVLGLPPGGAAWRYKKLEKTNDASDTLMGATELEFTAGAIPGTLAVYGRHAFPLLLGKGGVPVAGASSFRDGRLVVFGHDKFIQSRPTLLNHDEVLIRACKWASRSSGTNQRAGYMGNETSFLNLLNANGYTAEALSFSKLNESSSFALVIIPSMLDLPSSAALPVLTKYVNGGGALVIGCTAWADNSSCRGKGPWNVLIKESGLAWTGESTGAVPLSNGKAGATADLKDLQAASAAVSASLILEALGKKGAVIVPDNYRTLLSTLRSTFDVVDKQYIDWAADLKSGLLAAEVIHRVIPTASKPVVASPENIFYVVLQQFLIASLSSPGELPPHPAAEYFPGNVTYDAAELSVPRSVVIDLAKNAKAFLGAEKRERPCRRRCYTTFYAPPASIVKVQIEPPVIGFTILIGAHDDNLVSADFTGNNKTWSRFPRIAAFKDVVGSSASLSNPFGGLVYIKDVQQATENRVKVTVTGVVASGGFVLGQHSLEDWKQAKRSLKTPFLEFISDRMALVLPAAVAASVEDPAALMMWWDRAIDTHSDLLGVPPAENFQAITFDMQISCSPRCGAHSGYPVMIGLGPAENAVNLTGLSTVWATRNNWAFHHEIGHNHQNNDWTYKGGVEVINNLFALFVGNTLVGEPMATVHGSPRSNVWQLAGYINGGARYVDFTDPSTGLLFFRQLQGLYGWDSFKGVFRKYRGLSGKERPVTNEDKWDMLLTTFSHQVGLDLSPLFSSWGVPITSKGKASLAALPPTKATLTQFHADMNADSCADNTDRCAQQVAKGECKSGARNMNEHCPKACGFC